MRHRSGGKSNVDAGNMLHMAVSDRSETSSEGADVGLELLASDAHSAQGDILETSSSRRCAVAMSGLWALVE